MSMKESCLKQGPADHGPLANYELPPLFENKVLLAKSHVLLFMCYLGCFYTKVAGFNNFDKDIVLAQP